MGAILEFLFTNPFLLIILIGTIYTMFFRKSPAEKQPGNRPPNRPAARPNNRMPNFGGSPLMPPKPVQQTQVHREEPRPVQQTQVYREEPKPIAQRPQLRVLPGGSASAPNVSVNERLNHAAADEWIDPNYASAVESVRPVKSPVTAVSGVNSTVVPQSLTKNDLARAIVWSEILGPPRAKRPFRR